MTLPASGIITLQDLADEFGGSTPHSLSEYYRGGSLVPDTPANAGVPTSGIIRLSDFYGAEASVTTYAVATGFYQDANPVGGGATVTMAYNSNGTISINGVVAGTLFAGNWIAPTTGAPGTHHIRVTTTSGTFSSGTTGVDLALTSNRTWTVSVGSGATKNTIATVQIKSASGGTVLASGSVELEASSA